MPLHHRDLTDDQWATVDSLIPAPTIRKDGRGRPWKDRRAVLNGILWVLRTALRGGTFPNAIRRTRPVIADSSNGSALES